MMKNVSESLAGRIAVLDMSSLSMSEIYNVNNGLFNPVVDELKKREKSSEKTPKYINLQKNKTYEPIANIKY